MRRLTWPSSKTNGSYRKARRGELKTFVGIESPRESSTHSEIWINTAATAPEDATELMRLHLRTNDVLDRLRLNGKSLRGALPQCLQPPS